jgi:hypothetical protein
MSSIPATDATLARDYPKDLRDAYRAVIRRTSAYERHQQLLRLGEVSLAHLASLAFADYRRSRSDDPDAKVEELIGTIPRFTLGQYLALFRLTQKSLGRSEIFGIKRHEVNVRLDDARRWMGAIRAVEYARRIGASDIPKVIAEGAPEPVKAIRWLTFWEEFVAYRNRIAHADSAGWPIDAEGYFDAMVGPLESALVEALRTEYIDFVLLEYPVAALIDIRRSRKGWSQRFDGEYRGVPLLVEIERDEPPQAWESEVGCSYVLQHPPPNWLPHSRFFDLREGPPPSLVTASEPHVPHEVLGPHSGMLSGTPIETAQEVHSPLASEPAPRAKQAQPATGARGPTAHPTDEAPLEHTGDARFDAPADARFNAPAEIPFNAPAEVPSARAVAPPPQRFLSEGSTTSTQRSPNHAISSRSRSRISFSPWILWAILSLGLLAWVGFLFTADRVDDARLRVSGFIYFMLAAATVACALIAGGEKHPHGVAGVANTLGAILLFGTWATSTVHGLLANPRVQDARRQQMV